MSQQVEKLDQRDEPPLSQEDVEGITPIPGFSELAASRRRPDQSDGGCTDSDTSECRYAQSPSPSIRSDAGFDDV